MKPVLNIGRFVAAAWLAMAVFASSPAGAQTPPKSVTGVAPIVGGEFAGPLPWRVAAARLLNGATSSPFPEAALPLVALRSGVKPWLVTFQVARAGMPGTFCEGAIVGDKWVLTSASCVCPGKDMPPTDVLIAPQTSTANAKVLKAARAFVYYERPDAPPMACYQAPPPPPPLLPICIDPDAVPEISDADTTANASNTVGTTTLNASTEKSSITEPTELANHEEDLIAEASAPLPTTTFASFALVELTGSVSNVIDMLGSTTATASLLASLAPGGYTGTAAVRSLELESVLWAGVMSPGRYNFLHRHQYTYTAKLQPVACADTQVEIASVPMSTSPTWHLCREKNDLDEPQNAMGTTWLGTPVVLSDHNRPLLLGLAGNAASLMDVIPGTSITLAQSINALKASKHGKSNWWFNLAGLPPPPPAPKPVINPPIAVPGQECRKIQPDLPGNPAPLIEAINGAKGSAPSANPTGTPTLPNVTAPPVASTARQTAPQTSEPTASRLDRTQFFASCYGATDDLAASAAAARLRLKLLTPESKATIEKIFARYESLNKQIDLRQVAYLLGTAYRETRGRMVPVREGKNCSTDECVERQIQALVDEGRVKSNYALPDAKGRRYYGRGLAQLTKAGKYESVGKALGLKNTLLKDPDKALDPDIAVQILVDGMVRGLLGKGKLADYFNDVDEDWIGARAMVNPGSRRPEVTAGYGKVFYVCLGGNR